MEATPIQMAAPENIGSARPANSTSSVGSGDGATSFDRVLSEVSANAQEQADSESDPADADGETVTVTGSTITGALLGDWLLRSNLAIPSVVAPSSQGQATAAISTESAEGVGGVVGVGVGGTTTIAGPTLPVQSPDVDDSLLNAQVQAAQSVSEPIIMATPTSVVGEGTVDSASGTTEAIAPAPPEDDAIPTRGNQDARETTRNFMPDGQVVIESDPSPSNQQNSGDNSRQANGFKNGMVDGVQMRSPRADAHATFSMAVDSQEPGHQQRVDSTTPLPEALQTGQQTSAIGGGANILPVVDGPKDVKLADSLVSQIDQGIQLLSFPRRREVRITLEPESLGKVNITLVQEKDGAMMVRLTADSSVAKDLIESRLQELKAAFDRQGLKIEGFSIDLGQNPAFLAGNQGQGRGFTPGDSNSRTIPTSPMSTGISKEERPVADIGARPGLGLVDLRV